MPAPIPAIGNHESPPLAEREAMLAMLNILEDLETEKVQLIQAQRAALNILEDFQSEKSGLQLSNRAMLNVLEDFDEDKSQIARTNAAILNILDDFDREKQVSGHMNRAVLNILEDLDQEKSRTEAVNVELEQRVLERTAELVAINKRLQQSNRELEQFAYAASHDMKGPLRAVDHLALWIAEDAGDLLPEGSRRDLAMLRQRIDRMHRLLDDQLAYSRVGRVQHKVERVAAQELVREVVKLLAPPEKFTIVIGALPVLTTEQTPLEHVFLNLIGNAIKHHDRADGRIEIAARDLGEQVEFVVRDDGPGIPLEYHEQVFQMFKTLRPRDEIEGSGMGLALVKKIVDNQGGKVRLVSSPGQGAAFFFTWPKSRE